MAMVPAFGLTAIVWLGLLPLLGGAPIPLGIPPLPEDPVLAQVAPAECLFYASWSGMAVPDAKSPNQTEQLLAEPEVREFCKAIDRTISGYLGQAAAQGRAFEAYAARLLEEAAHLPAASVKSAAPAGANDLVELFAPVRGLFADGELDFSRNPSTGRPIDLS